MSGLKLLLVDDEPSVLITLAANLELEGFEVETAANAQEALRAVEKRTFDLVLSDIRMPGLSGIDLFRRLKALRPTMPVLLTTAFFLEAQVRDAVGEGVFAVVPKPVDIETVAAVLRRAGQKPFVLIVDDAQPHAVSLAEALSAAGVRARAVFDGKSAIREIQRGDVDVCVTDVVMPEMDGAKLVEEVRKLDPSVSIIVFSGHSVADAMTKIAARGAYACLRKPFDPKDLIDAIAKARMHDAAARP